MGGWVSGWVGVLVDGLTNFFVISTRAERILSHDRTRMTKQIKTRIRMDVCVTNDVLVCKFGSTVSVTDDGLHPPIASAYGISTTKVWGMC